MNFVDHFVEIEALVEPLSPKFLLRVDIGDVIPSFLFLLPELPHSFDLVYLCGVSRSLGLHRSVSDKVTR